ncbi:response regulator [Nocardioides lianchengensis]|uniref:Response regulator receiver domain-containing protein n=1 Tax=Nocardioides lianchengensis TaxID=1045774 RepID=A0A1G6NCV5_9ACTN|nr:response regulator [Nocardioides lianchengensis]NYG10732.1 DNA-binding response OmpR family regulator [Nocardioides lianchengensis]SDC65638.1 Response regulator receiver domain-containing protein [Nocardioides lianchengensis]
MSIAPAPSTAPVALVIEDDEDTTDLLDLVLSQAGFSVITAVNGAEGTELARVHQPALTTIDVSMPGMDGLETTRRIREFSGTYIVIISTRSAEHDILAGFDAGADDYVPKPIRPRELQARLAAVARRPVTTFAAQPVAAMWAAADEDAERSAYHRQVVAGVRPAVVPLEVLPAQPEPEERDADDVGEDGRDGMLQLGMRFVGSWIEFYGLRINPARSLVVVDDRLVDLNPRQFDLLQLMLYSGTRTRSARYLALRLRGETEETTHTQAYQDRDWVESLMENLLNRLGERHLTPRWIEARPGSKFRLVRPE